MNRVFRPVAVAAMAATLAAPALAEMSPDMSCLDFTNLVMSGGATAAADATKMLKEAAAAAGTLPEKLAQTTAVGALANATAERCNMNPEMSAMDAMLEGN